MHNLKTFNISFEFFPPKSVESSEQLCAVALKLAECMPHFFSVTFGAGGSTRDGTVDTVKMLQQKTAVQVVPHLSCIGSNRQDIIQIIDCYQQMNVEHLLALRGDLPSGAGQAGEFKYAYELVQFIRKITGEVFKITVAAYPEIHPEANKAQDDILALKRKYEAGANAAITQYFFNPDAYFYYLDECNRLGINLPIIPGIMLITNFQKLCRFSHVCGAEIPQWIRKRLESYEDEDSIKKFGLEVVYSLCRKLIDGGANGLHFYTLNKAEATITLLKMLFGSDVVRFQSKQNLMIAE